MLKCAAHSYREGTESPRGVMAAPAELARATRDRNSIPCARARQASAAPLANERERQAKKFLPIDPLSFRVYSGAQMAAFSPVWGKATLPQAAILKIAGIPHEQLSQASGFMPRTRPIIGAWLLFGAQQPETL
ncbi:hypothetical protein [Desulfovibrio sp. SGI.169]|uniref:hypothetical protein n=1 Tax=Desulfovibrio sp. SGI.169 TaxID=3420561 RepID=UPI003D03EF35